MKYQVVIIVLVCGVVLQQHAECKRSGGSRSRGTSGRGTLWGNNNKKKSGSGNAPPVKPEANPDAVALSYPKQTGSVPSNKPKPSAPKLETRGVQKQVASVPQANQKPIGFDNVNKPAAAAGTGAVVASAPVGNIQSNQQKPIGWNVPNQQNQGQLQTKTLANQQQSAAGYPGQVGNGGYGQSGYPSGNPGSPGHAGYGQPGYGQPGQPSYGQPGYGQPAYGNSYSPGQASPPGYGQNYNPHYPQQPGYHPPSYGNPNVGGGNFGSQYGGGHGGGYGGYGGYGGMGGMGGMGMGGFGGGYGGMMGPKRSFGSGFATTAFTSVATGLLVWSLMRGGRSQHYNVYNHYNHPEAVPQEIALPANIITLCPENVTLLCAPNTVPLCTANETILCAVTATATVPCEDNAAASCVNTSPPCTADCGAPADNTTVLPCIANATVSGQVNLANGNQEAADMTMSLFQNSSQNADTVLCVTTMAMPSPAEDEAAKAAMEATTTTHVPPVPNLNSAPNEQSSALPTTTI